MKFNNDTLNNCSRVIFTISVHNIKGNTRLELTKFTFREFKEMNTLIFYDLWAPLYVWHGKSVKVSRDSLERPKVSNLHFKLNVSQSYSLRFSWWPRRSVNYHHICQTLKLTDSTGLACLLRLSHKGNYSRTKQLCDDIQPLWLTNIIPYFWTN